MDTQATDRSITPGDADALLIVDVQNDFLPGGALAVPDGDAVIPVLNRCIERFAARGLPVFATRDWHPADHCSFVPQGGPWPAHCVAGTEGAAFAAGLALPPDAVIVSKADAPDKEAYSGFAGTNLDDLLAARHVRRLFVGGLATDYCVKNTVLDAIDNGFEVFLLLDAIRSVDVRPGDGARAIEAMARAGARTIRSGQLT
ncbi:MAG: isochorismatase family protein [Mariprofundaceae bacterium]